MLMVLTLAVVGSVEAQKVKYKDIYPDLEDRKFNKVEKDLTTFLADPKNDDHANAHYQMGLIIEAKFLLHDVLADTAELFDFGAKAISYYTKSKSLITEKEVKKNEEYYQAFYRRDLRTGDFGIKVSDVHLDIEQKVAALNERIAAIASLHESVMKLTEIESQMLTLFNGLVENSSSFSDYMMKSDLEAISQLGDLQALFRSFDDMATATVEAGESLKVEDYFKSVEYTTIEGFESLEPIFPEDNAIIKTYQLGDWASATKLALNEEVFALKADILDFDRKIVSARARLQNHVPTEYPKAVPSDMQRTFERYDTASVAHRLLQARVLEAMAMSLSDTAINRTLLDSTAIERQVQISDSVLQACRSMHDLLDLSADEVEAANAYYDEYFAGSFDGVAGVKTYAQVGRNWASSMIEDWDTIYHHWNLRYHYGFTPTDTIPLRPMEDSFVNDYLTSGHVDVGGDTIVSWGVKPDTLLGFVVKFGVDRKMIWETTFESSLLAEGEQFDFASDTIAAGEGSTSFFIYDETPSSANDIIFLNVDLESGEISWVTDAIATRKPQYAVYTPNGKETTIFLYPQEEYPLTNGEVGFLIIDKDGAVR